MAGKSLYCQLEVCVRVNGKQLKSFHGCVGFWRRCVLSPLLFIIYMNWIVKLSRTDELCHDRTMQNYPTAFRSGFSFFDFLGIWLLKCIERLFGCICHCWNENDWNECWNEIAEITLLDDIAEITLLK